MGTLLRDYNRVLEKQPRKPIDLPKFDVHDSLQLRPLVGTLSIPDPVRFSQLEKQTTDLSNEPSHPQLDQTPIQSLQPRNLSPIIDNQIKQEQSPQEKQLIIRNPSYSFRPHFQMYNQTMYNDAHVIARSVLNFDNHQQFNNYQLSPFRPNHTIIEHNGKQFLTELRARMERRYVEVFDQYEGRMRLFEVTDYIPTRIIREIRSTPASQSQRRAPTNRLLPNFPSSQNSRRLTMPSDRTQATQRSNLVDFMDLNNRETHAREFDLYQSGAKLPINNNNNAPPPISSQRHATRPNSSGSSSSHSEYSQPDVSSSFPASSQNVSNQHPSRSYRSQVPSFRSHSSSSTSHSTNSSETNSTTPDDHSDSESIDRTLSSYNRNVQGNRNNAKASYETSSGYNSPTQFDPFAKTVSTGDHHYARRPGVNNYSQPTINNRRLQNSAVSDYAPIPATHYQPNRSQYSHSGDSNAYDG